MTTSELLPDVLALLNIGADLNIIDFQFAIDNGFVFKLIAQLFCIHNVNGMSNQEGMVEYIAGVLLEFDGHCHISELAPILGLVHQCISTSLHPL